MHVCMGVYLCTSCIPKPVNVRRGLWNPLNWSYRQLRAEVRSWELNLGPVSEQ